MHRRAELGGKPAEVVVVGGVGAAVTERVGERRSVCVAPTEHHRVGSGRPGHQCGDGAHGGVRGRGDQHPFTAGDGVGGDGDDCL